AEHLVPPVPDAPVLRPLFVKAGEVARVRGEGRTHRRDEVEDSRWVGRKSALVGPITAVGEPMAAPHQTSEVPEELSSLRLRLPRGEDVTELHPRPGGPRLVRERPEPS